MIEELLSGNRIRYTKYFQRNLIFTHNIGIYTFSIFLINILLLILKLDLYLYLDLFRYSLPTIYT